MCESKHAHATVVREPSTADPRSRSFLVRELVTLQLNYSLEAAAVITGRQQHTKEPTVGSRLMKTPWDTIPRASP